MFKPPYCVLFAGLALHGNIFLKRILPVIMAVMSMQWTL